ncbi:MAG: AAA family ATPase [Aestuariivita sp.]|nr:AAA family ATPase [Aestuariivita sp.]
MNLRKLYEHLDANVRGVLQTVADSAAREARRSISIELFLLGLLRDKHYGPSLIRALAAANGRPSEVESALAELVTKQPRTDPGTLPRLGETLAQLLRESWNLGLDDYGENLVTAVRVYETLARRSELWPQLITSLPGMASLDVAKLAASKHQAVSSQDDETVSPPATNVTFPELSRYGRDMVADALDKKLDPVIGLHSQMHAIAAILLRRRQNSVAVVGESGVGKSACSLGFVDALAHRRDIVPKTLHDTPVWSLDLSALRAGAVVRGALEERLQAIVKEVTGTGMILLIDDIHLLFGDQSGGADALRSVLNVGSVRILTSCGWREWRRYVEPDPGLARRIASVRIQEPTDSEALSILSGIAPALAEHHNVAFDTKVLESVVSLSRRYIVGRHLPDKAIVVLDSASARARMLHQPTIDIPEKKINQADASENKQTQVSDDKVTVEESDVAAVVSDLTGVPIGGMLSDVSKMASWLEQTLGERVVGQDDALARCASQARSYLAGLSDRRRPVGALMFCGPSGVGKTETAHALADTLFGGRLLTVNMSEYQEAHTVSGLKGAPAGYVGYGEGGVLTEGVRRTPYCVVLLDEIEKAHRDVIEMLYQILDRGWMEDAEGIEADFSNALIILTTNAGDKIIEKIAGLETIPDENTIQQHLSQELGKYFPAAFIGRLQLVPYWPLDADILETIAGMRLDRLSETYKASHRRSLVFDKNVRNWLVQHVRTTPQGARFLDGIISRSIRPAVAEYILSCLSENELLGDIAVTYQDGEFLIVDHKKEDSEKAYLSLADSSSHQSSQSESTLESPESHIDDLK